MCSEIIMCIIVRASLLLQISNLGKTCFAALKNPLHATRNDVLNRVILNSNACQWSKKKLFFGMAE